MEQTDFQKLLDEYNKLYITYLKKYESKETQEKEKERKNPFFSRESKTFSNIPFENAIQENCLLVAMDIINRSDNIDEKTTYLSIACKHNKLELVEKLIQEGANLEVKYGKSPIVYSFENKNLDIIKLLHTNGAKIPVILLLQSVKNFNKEKREFEESRDPNSYMNRMNRMNITDPMDMIRYFVEEAGMDVNTEGYLGSDNKLTPLKIAMEHRNLELFTYLVDNDADINKIGYDGYTPLIYAIILDDKEKTEQAEYNAEAYDDEAQILRQETIGNIFAKYLIEKGADVSIPSTRGCVVEKIKVRKMRSPYRNKNYIDSDDDEYEVIRSEEWTPLYYAITLGDRNSWNGWNPEISIAIINKLSIEKINHIDKNGRTYLHWAIKKNRKALYEILVDKGIDIYIKDNDGKIPFDLITKYTSINKDQKEKLKEKHKKQKIEQLESIIEQDRKNDLSQQSLLSKLPDDGFIQANFEQYFGGKRKTRRLKTKKRKTRKH